KVSADLVAAGRDQTDHGRGPARARTAGKSPHRTGEEQLEPLLAKRAPAPGDRLLQPGIPGGEKGIGNPSPKEVTVTWELAIQTEHHRARHVCLSDPAAKLPEHVGRKWIPYAQRFEQ